MGQGGKAGRGATNAVAGALHDAALAVELRERLGGDGDGVLGHALRVLDDRRVRLEARRAVRVALLVVLRRQVEVVHAHVAQQRLALDALLRLQHHLSVMWGEGWRCAVKQKEGKEERERCDTNLSMDSMLATSRL